MKCSLYFVATIRLIVIISYSHMFINLINLKSREKLCFYCIHFFLQLVQFKSAIIKVKKTSVQVCIQLDDNSQQFQLSVNASWNRE